MKPYSYNEIKNFVSNCQGCVLSQTRNKAVMGKGLCKKRIMLIGEAPGQNEDRDGLPFTGRSGKLLDEILLEAGLSRDDVYITNIVKCRPPGNRDPRIDEQERCISYLRHEFAALKPEIVVCLGRVAAQRIIRRDFKITREHGEFVSKNGTLFTAVFHPSAVLRDPRRRESLVSDFANIVGKLEEKGDEGF